MNKKKLGDLISFQKRLVKEKGLPPSKLMLEQAALASSRSVQAEQEVRNHFKCDKCDYATNLSHEVKVHMENIHHELQKPVVPIGPECESEVDKQQEHPQDPPEVDLKCPSCLNKFSTEHSLSRHIHFSDGQGVGDGWYKVKVKCHLCDNTETSCKRNRNFFKKR